MARVEVQSERRPVPHRLERPLRGPEVVGDLARVHLVREPHALGVEHVKYGVPPRREVLVTARDHRLWHRREHRDRVPDRRPGEPDHRPHAERRRGPRGVRDLGRRPLPHPFWRPVTPDARGQDPLVPLVDRVVADRLPDQVAGDGKAAQPVLVEQFVPPGQVPVLAQRAVDLEMVAPAGKLEPVVPPRARELADLLERQVRPLPGEKGEWPCHKTSKDKNYPERTGPTPVRPTVSHPLPPAALRCTASSTRCTASPSLNDGSGCIPSAIAVSRSLA